MRLKEKMQASAVRARPLVAATIAMIIVCACGAALAQNALLTPASIQEFIDSEEQVSGGSTVGAVYFKAGDSIEPTALYAYFREPTGGDLKLTVSSIDGRYSGEIEYSVETPVNGWVQLAFPTENPGFVKQYSIDELAGLLTGGGSNELYPLRWGSGADADHVRLYVNSERARAFFYREEAGGRKITYCESPSSASGFKFNSICDIPVGQITAENGVKIHRKFGIRTVDPIRVNLLMPTPQGLASGGE